MRLWADIKVCSRPLAGFLSIGFAWAAFAAQVPVLKAQIGASDGFYGTLILFASCGALMAMWLAPLAQRLAGHSAMLLGAALMVSGFLTAGLSTLPLVFALAMFVAAAGSGILDVLINAEVSAIESREGRSLMNLNHALYSFAYGTAALLVAPAREADWTPLAIFGVLVVAVALLSVLMLLGRPALGGEEPDETRSFPHLIVWLGGTVVLVAFLAEAASEGWSALHLERTLGGSPGEGALGPAILGLSMGIGRFGGHALASRFSDMPMMGGALMLAAFGLFLAGAAPTVSMAYLGFALGGLGVSVVGPLALAIVGRSVPPAARLTAISRAAVLGYGAFFMGPPLMGFVAEAFGLRASFYVIGFLLIAVVLAVLPLFSRQVARQGA